MIRDLATTQSRERIRLVTQLRKVCSDCDGAYDELITRLVPLRDVHVPPQKLAQELRTFAADTNTRNLFKPEGLCKDINDLLEAMNDNLKALKYSVDVFAISDIQAHLQQLGDYDHQMYHQYDRFRNDLHRIADQISASNPEQSLALAALARSTIADVCEDLENAINNIRKVSSSIVEIA
jgi:septation ring formation regulator EzrA